jgi:uncharacterized protein involved in exopolysaccharide biosynthesis
VSARQPESDDDLSIADFVGLIRQRWRLIAVITVVCTALTAAAAFLMTPVYEARVVLAPAKEEGTSALDKLAGSFGGFAELAGVDLGGGSSSKDEAVALLQSKLLTTQFIKDENLLPVLFARQWDAESGAWKETDSDEIPSLDDAFKLWDEDVRKVETSTTSELITLTIEWKDRELAARWAGELVRRANELMRARAIADAGSSISFLKSELEKTNVLEVRQAIYSLAESHFKTMALAKAREEYYFRVIDPPVAPDRDDYVSPKRALMIAAAVIGGAMLGLMVVIFLNAIGPARRDPTRG